MHFCFCIFLGQAVESEGNDRADLMLPGSQLQLLKDAVANSKKIAGLDIKYM